MLAVLFHAFRERRRAATAAGQGGGDPGVAVPAEVRISDHERLAREGRFAEAIHALLLRALRLLDPRSALAISLTSREIHRTAELSEGRREDLGVLVRAVEVSRFGGGDVGRSEYETCRTRFARLTESRGAA